MSAIKTAADRAGFCYSRWLVCWATSTSWWGQAAVKVDVISPTRSEGFLRGAIGIFG